MRWFHGRLIRRRMDRDLAENIQQHFEEKVDSLTAQGMSPREADVPLASLSATRSCRGTGARSRDTGQPFSARDGQGGRAACNRSDCRQRPGLAGGVAALVPASRAILTEPVEALRSE